MADQNKGGPAGGGSTSGSQGEPSTGSRSPANQLTEEARRRGGVQSAEMQVRDEQGRFAGEEGGEGQQGSKTRGSGARPGQGTGPAGGVTDEEGRASPSGAGIEGEEGDSE